MDYTRIIIEGVWKKAYGDEKDLLNGLILVAAPFGHYQKNENDIALYHEKSAKEVNDSK